MTERDPEVSDPTRKLAEAVAGFGATALRQRKFLARKRARVFMDENGLTSRLDETLDAALEQTFGTGVEAGIALGMRGTTDQRDIDMAVDDLMSQLPPSLRHPTLEVISSRMIPVGIEFGREIAEGSDRVTEWSDEFRLHQATDPDHEFWGE